MNDMTRSILEMEKRYYQFASSKEEAIRAELGLNPIRYYTALNEMLDDECVIAAEPVLTARLRRIRDSRAKQRRAS